MALYKCCFAPPGAGRSNNEQILKQEMRGSRATHLQVAHDIDEHVVI